jgi:hypothetical protein
MEIIVLELASFLVTLAGLPIAVAALVIGYLALRRTPKPPKPPFTPSCIVIEGVKMPEPRSLPGHDRGASRMGFNRRSL